MVLVKVKLLAMEPMLVDQVTARDQLKPMVGQPVDLAQAKDKAQLVEAMPQLQVLAQDKALPM